MQLPCPYDSSSSLSIYFSGLRAICAVFLAAIVYIQILKTVGDKLSLRTGRAKIKMSVRTELKFPVGFEAIIIFVILDSPPPPPPSSKKRDRLCACGCLFICSTVGELGNFYELHLFLLFFRIFANPPIFVYLPIYFFST